MVLDAGEMPVLIQIWSSGTVEDPCLHLELSGEQDIPAHVARWVENAVCQMLNLQEDLTPMYRELDMLPGIGDLIRDLRGLKSPTTPTVYESLVDSIIEQQISLRVAYQIEHRLIRETGIRLTFDGLTYFCYPTPDLLAKTSPDVFRGCGMTTRKSEYIRDISRQITHGAIDLESLKTIQDTEEIISRLCSIRGIGRWTAELTMLRGFHRHDAFPAADIYLRRMMGERFCDGRKITAEEARDIAEPWGRWKGLLAFYLEVADRMRRSTG